jgi:tetratricopeptide (TPR) repeat protein
MDQETAQQILTQLCWIKYLIASLVVPVLVVAIIMIMEQLRIRRSACSSPDAAFRKFYREANKLLQDAEYDEVLELAQKRIADKPDDCYGYWFSGVARFRKGQFADALESFEKALDVEPAMERQIGPYIARCREQTEKASSDA